MKLPFPTLRLIAASSLAAGLMIGCEDFLSADKSAGDGTTPAADESGALSLSIKDDSACRGEWHAVLDARKAGHPDSAYDSAFLASCVTEVKAGPGRPKPAIPPALVPDSGTRCKWIVAQIEGGRDSLTVSYRKYCPEDCRKLEAADTVSHGKLCCEPGRHPIDSLSPRPHGDDSLLHRPHGDDSLPHRPHGDDSLPHRPHGDDSLPHRPHGDDSLSHRPHGDDSLPHRPHGDDSLPHRPHGDDTLPPQPMPGDDTCKMLHDKLETVKSGEPGRADLEHLFAARCGGVLPPPPTHAHCDELRLKPASLDTASADYARMSGWLQEHCPDAAPK